MVSPKRTRTPDEIPNARLSHKRGHDNGSVASTSASDIGQPRGPDRQFFQVINSDGHVWQVPAGHVPRRIDRDAAHPVTGFYEIDQVINPTSYDALSVSLRRLTAFAMVEQKARRDFPFPLLRCPQIPFEITSRNSSDPLCPVRDLPIGYA